MGFWEDWDARQLKAKEERESQCLAEEYVLQQQGKGGVVYPGYSVKSLPDIPRCKHTGNVLVFQTKHLRVYGGGASRGAYLIPHGIVIDLAGGMVEDTIVTVKGFSCPTLLENIKIRSIDIHWKDRSVISWPIAAWKGLLADLTAEAQKQKKPLDVLVACMGGHGRTGTALAIMAYWSNAIPKTHNPVDWIRKNYCLEAVETARQKQYVDDSTWAVVQ
jgi:hypothetical protein